MVFPDGPPLVLSADGKTFEWGPLDEFCFCIDRYQETSFERLLPCSSYDDLASYGPYCVTLSVGASGYALRQWHPGSRRGV